MAKLAETFEGASPSDLTKMLAVATGFHGTRFRQNVEKIVQDGLLAPGELAPSTGHIVQVSTGARFGEGIYLSPTLRKAQHYALSDSRNHHQVFF